MVIKRNLAKALREAARHYPVVTLTGPRQSGKTTLCRAVFSDKPHVSLEQLDVREYAVNDPRGFLEEYRDGAIFDEVQNAPGLLSYLQAEVDERPEVGRFILSGSQHFALSNQIAQSLAGRTAVMILLPLSHDEVARFGASRTSLLETMWRGGYPRIHDRQIPPDRWLADYLSTYVQRDVREVLKIGDLQLFTRFTRLCAGHTGQVLNLSRLGADAGVSHNTARAWLGVLETSFLCLRVPAWHVNLRKQTTKAPKLHFVDTGLACHLIGIHNPEQLRHHPLRGALFESWVATEIYKQQLNRGRQPSLFHLRQSRGVEIDLVIESAAGLCLIEAKSGATFSQTFLGPMAKLEAQASQGQARPVLQKTLVYGGDRAMRRDGFRIVPWHALPQQRWPV